MKEENRVGTMRTRSEGKSVKEHDDCGNLMDNDGNTADNEEVECLNSPFTPVCDTNSFENQSKWLQWPGTGLVVEPHHLCNAETGAEFACIHICDSSYFMNKEKFLWYMLRKTKSTEPYEWALLDETGSNIIEHVVEDEDQGPSKEWVDMAGINILLWKISLRQVKVKLYGCPPWFPFYEVMFKCRCKF